MARDDQGCRSVGEERFIKMSGGAIPGPRGVFWLSRTVAQMVPGRGSEEKVLSKTWRADRVVGMKISVREERTRTRTSCGRMTPSKDGAAKALLGLLAVGSKCQGQ